MNIRCLVFGHVPYAPAEVYPVIMCRHCTKTTRQVWYPNRWRGWVRP